MPRKPILSFDRGTLILHPPPRGKAWIDFAEWDDRIEKFRIPALHYRALVEKLRASNISFEDKAASFAPLGLEPSHDLTPYPHQREALQAWKAANRQGVVVLPTGAGKSFLALLAIAATPRQTLIVVPTLDLMHQWYAQLKKSFPGVEVGLLGGGSRDRTPLLVSTYNSAAINAETLGSQYGLVIFDECHHLPSDFNRVIAEYSLAPYRLGLSATPERSDGRHGDLNQLIGPEVYRRSAEQLADSNSLADYEVRQIKVQLTEAERDRYRQLIAQRNAFMRNANLSFGGLGGWQRFIQVCSKSAEGRQAMLAHHQAKAIALGNAAKFELLEQLLGQHYPDKTLIFTSDNATVYRISQDFLIPAITHKTPVKERHDILSKFRSGAYRSLVVANVLDEGVDVPDATIAIFLAGTGSSRQFIQRLGRILRRGAKPGKQAILYEVIAEDTVEEGVSQRRHSSVKRPQQEPPSPSSPAQLELLPRRLPGPISPPVSPYKRRPQGLPQAAEAIAPYDVSPPPPSPTRNAESTVAKPPPPAKPKAQEYCDDEDWD